MSGAVTTGLFTLAGVALGGAIGLLEERIRRRVRSEERLRLDRQHAYAQFLATALTAMQDAVILAGAERHREALGIAGAFLRPVSKEALRDDMFRLGDAGSALQILGSPEILAAVRPVQALLVQAVMVVTGERKDPAFFDGVLDKWRELRADFLDAARKDLGIMQANWLGSTKSSEQPQSEATE
jgi:hypothetical protein